MKRLFATLALLTATSADAFEAGHILRYQSREAVQAKMATMAPDQAYRWLKYMLCAYNWTDVAHRGCEAMRYRRNGHDAVGDLVKAARLVDSVAPIECIGEAPSKSFTIYKMCFKKAH